MLQAAVLSGMAKSITVKYKQRYNHGITSTTQATLVSRTSCFMLLCTSCFMPCQRSRGKAESFNINYMYIKILQIRKFSREFYFRKSVKRHMCDVKNSRLWNGLPISVNVKVIAPFREDSRNFAKINPRENFRIYSKHCCMISLKQLK